MEVVNALMASHCRTERRAEESLDTRAGLQLTLFHKVEICSDVVPKTFADGI